MDARLKEAWEKAMSVPNPKHVIDMEYIGTIRDGNRFYKFFYDKERSEYKFYTLVE